MQNPILIRLCGLFLLVLLPFMGAVGTTGIFVTIPHLETPDAGQVITGTARGALETKFDDDMPHRDVSLTAWGRLEYTLFHRGRPGVVIGRDGWLFTSEEFTVHRDDKSNYINNINYIKYVFNKLNQENIALVVAPIPAKTRLYADVLPAKTDWPTARMALYPALIGDLTAATIPVTDLSAALKRARTDSAPVFLKTDTHWTPHGAESAALAIARTTRGLNVPLGETQKFERLSGPTERHDGDLRRYVPLGTATDRLIPSDFIKTPMVTTAGDLNAEDLFGDVTPPVALVGTSYSANPKWGFAASLKQAISVDVLNAADEGQGPFTTMQAYLKGDSFRKAPPKLIIWEIPERFLTVNYKLDTL